MADLERRLQALAAGAFPPAPDVRAAVAARIAVADPGAQAGVEASGGWWRWPRVLALALALVLVPAAALAAVPGTRHAILDWLGLEHVRVYRVPEAPVPGVRGLDRSDLGRRAASVHDAERQAGFPIVVPRALGAPDAVYVTRDGIVSLAYSPRPGLPADRRTGFGLLVTELRASGVTRYVAKLAGPDTRIQRVRVGAAPGVYLSGAPHELLIERPSGVVGPLAPRLAGNTLAFERGELVIRLEGRLDREEALTLARSLPAAGG